jgi:hypothetical protein
MEKFPGFFPLLIAWLGAVFCPGFEYLAITGLLS